MTYIYYNLVYYYSNQIRTLPSEFDCKFTLNRQIHSYNTRNSHAFRLPFCRTNIKQFSVFYQGPKFYNSLTTEIVNSSSPASFKKPIKAFICKKILVLYVKLLNMSIFRWFFFSFCNFLFILELPIYFVII